MASITELRPERRRTWIYLDGRRLACVPSKWLFTLNINVGDEVDADELEGNIASRQFESAYEYAIGLLAASMKSSAQIERKLRDRGCCELAARMVVERLTENRLIDDAQYAKRRAEILNRGGKGRRAALTDMRAKGVDPETARAALDDWDAEAEQRSANDFAYKYMAQRYDDPQKARQLTYAALARRGYASDVARAALKSAADRLADENQDE